MRPVYAYLMLAAVYLAMYLAAPADYIGDTVRYASSALHYASGVGDAEFWDFGHLFWRPWAYTGFLALGPASQSWFGDSPLQAIIRFLVLTNFVCAWGALTVLFSILLRVTRCAVALAVTAAMGFTLAFINYSHSGAPYVPAFLFSLLALRLLIAAVEGGRTRYAALAGLAFAFTCGLWFPYAFTGLGMLGVLFFWRGGNQPRNSLAAWFLAVFGVATAILFGAGARADGVQNVAEFKRWMLKTESGWTQTSRLTRSVTGVPRGVWNFGDQTVQMKRALFQDPYNPRSRALVLGALGGALAVFYLGLAAAIAILLRTGRQREFVIFTAAALPLFLFAVFLFEPSSTERFLPAFPFLFLIFALALDQRQAPRWLSFPVILLLVAFPLNNLLQAGRLGSEDRVSRTARRIAVLESSAKPGALVFAVTFQDDIYRIPALRPLDRRLAPKPFLVTDTLEVASARMEDWRGEFIRKTLAQWDAGQEVWIAERHLASRPDAEWLWVEGDDPRIRWRNLGEFFKDLEYDANAGAGRDGFLRVANSEANRRRFASR